MKKLCLFFLLAFFSTLYGQSTEELIQQIRVDYAYINEELLPKCSIIDRDMPDSNHDFELYVFLDEEHCKWKLIQVIWRSGFADGHDAWQTETFYYFSNQKLIFSYKVENAQGYDAEEEHSKVYLGRTEERFYYADGQLIRHLQKTNRAEAKYSNIKSTQFQLKEDIKHLPSQEIAPTDTWHYERAKAWISKLVEDWGYGVEQPEW